MGARTGPVSKHRENCDHGMGGLTGARSIEDILAVHMAPYIDYIGDNAPAHTPQKSCKITLQKSVFELWRGQHAVLT